MDVATSNGTSAMSRAELQQLRAELFPEQRRRHGFEDPSEVYSEEGGFKLFLGDEHDACNLEVLDTKTIRYVLNLVPHEVETTELYGDKYRCRRLRLEDKETFDISRHMKSALEFIEEARVDRAGILVHCSAGVSRSATVVIAFLMTYQKWPLRTAASYCYERRSIILPNIGFMEYLVKLDKTLQNSM